jgi:Rrf2 family protein
MFRFGKQVESALLALKALGELKGEGLPISEICAKHGLSKNTLSKIMQNLQSANILDSSLGLKGGYKLQRHLKDISFYDVLDALGEIKKLKCSNNETCDLVQNCSISSPLQTWEKQFEESLKSTSMETLLNEKNSSGKIIQSPLKNKSETTCL